MSRKTSVPGSCCIVLVCFTFALMLAIPGGVGAQQKTAEIEGVGYNVNWTMADNLKSFTGKKVSVTIDSGKTFTGTVKAVGEQMVHLEKLEGKEYFDALISLDSIIAMDTRFRN